MRPVSPQVAVMLTVMMPQGGDGRMYDLPDPLKLPPGQVPAQWTGDVSGHAEIVEENGLP